jgi:molecular chaperone GrpE
MNEEQISQSDECQNDLSKQLEAARQEAAENHDKYLRALAESENMRKRMERLCDDRVWHEKKRLLTQLLELADQLEAAFKYAPADDPVGTGIRMTYQQLQKTLDQEGVQTLQALGETFDPNIHEAIELTDGPGEPNKVTYEYRKGYTLNGKLLRPARVQVTKAH